MQSLQYFLNESLLLEKASEVMQSKQAIPLSKIDPAIAKEAMRNGLKDGSIPDDQIEYKYKEISAGKLRGAQTEIIPEKAIGMAIGLMLRPGGKIGGDLGSIISDDNFIMDGHHRWAATYLCDPTASVGGTVINLPGKLLITALNVVTKGKFDRDGNPGKGNIKDFTSKVIGKILDEYVVDGIPGEFPISAQDVKDRLCKVPGANGSWEKGVEIMKKNADKLPKQILPGAPDRIDMPVIKPDEVQDVAKELKAGEIDITKPYFK